MSHQGQHHKSLNCPEENDETWNEQCQSGIILAQINSFDNPIALSRVVEGQTFSHQHNPMRPSLTQSWVNLIQHDQLRGPCQQSLYYPSYHSRSPGGGQTSSLPSYLPSTEYQNYLGADCIFPSWRDSHPGTQSPNLNSLEQPGSLHSFYAAGSSIHTNQVRPFPGLHCGYYGPVPLQVNQDNFNPGPGYQPPHRPKGIWIEPVKIPWNSNSGSLSMWTNKYKFITASNLPWFILLFHRSWAVRCLTSWQQ